MSKLVWQAGHLRVQKLDLPVDLKWMLFAGLNSVGFFGSLQHARSYAIEEFPDLFKEGIEESYE